LEYPLRGQSLESRLAAQPRVLRALLVRDTDDVTPANWSFWVASINFWPLVYVVSLGGVGAIVAYWLRAASWSGVASRAIVVALVGLSLGLHLLTSCVLAVDPQRNSGDIPLPFPFPGIAKLLLLLAIIPGLLSQGFLLGGLSRAGENKPSVMWKAAHVAAVVYSIWVLPWALGVISD
jgi:hypothetical protein